MEIALALTFILLALALIAKKTSAGTVVLEVAKLLGTAIALTFVVVVGFFTRRGAAPAVTPA